MNKIIKISFVQGRLSPFIGSKYQYFPIDNWSNEFTIARKIGISNIEWIISDFSNPLFNNLFLQTIIKNLKKNKVTISSISLDLMMINGNYLHSMNIKDLEWLITRINILSNKLGKIRINIPFEENSSIFNTKQSIQLIRNLEILSLKVSKNFLLSIETDMSPKNIKYLLKKKGFKRIGLNIDIGNVNANGYNLEEYFDTLKEKIFSFHIKNRGLLFSKSKMLSNNKNLKLLISNLHLFKNLNDISLQTYRDKYRPFTQLKKNFKFLSRKV